MANTQKQPSTRLQVVRHPGIPCGERIPCPLHGLPLGPHYPVAERLRNGTIVAHDCGRTWRPSEQAA